MSKLTTEQMRPYVKLVLEARLAEDEKERAMPSSDFRLADYHEELATLRRILGGHDEPSRPLESVTENALWLVGLEANMPAIPALGSPEHAMIRREVAKCLLPFFQALQARADGDIEAEERHLGALRAAAPEAQPVTGQPAKLKASGPMLSKLAADYLKHREDELGGRTIVAYRDAIKSFLEIVGDMPTSELGHLHLTQFYETFRKLPAHRKTAPSTRGKSIQELLKMEFPPEERVAVKTANDCLGNIGSFLTWAVNHGHIAENYAAKKGTRQRKSVRETRYALIKPEELKTLFASELFTTWKARKVPWHFWMPLLGHFTGARAGELAQLTVDDVYPLPSGIWVMSINDSGEKTVKTAASLRVIPLHPVLTETLKFPKFVAAVRARKHKRLFHTMKAVQKEPGRPLSKWFGGFLEKLGIRAPEDRNRKVFHSFRHNFKTACKLAKVTPSMADDFIGHESSGMAAHYEHETPPDILYEEVVLKMNLGVDLGHLAENPYIKEL